MGRSDLVVSLRPCLHKFIQSHLYKLNPKLRAVYSHVVCFFLPPFTRCQVLTCVVLPRLRFPPLVSTEHNSPLMFEDWASHSATSSVSRLHGDLSLNPTPGDSVVGGKSSRKQPWKRQSSEGRRRETTWDLDCALCFLGTSTAQDRGLGWLRGLQGTGAGIPALQALGFD